MLLPLLLLPIFAGLFWFVVVLPQRRMVEAHEALVASLAVGQEIVTSTGLYGTIVALDGEVAQLELAPGVVVRIDKRAVGEVVGADAADAADTADTADEAGAGEVAA